jgi:hypothetical protein
VGRRTAISDEGGECEKILINSEKSKMLEKNGKIQQKLVSRNLVSVIPATQEAEI